MRVIIKEHSMHAPDSGVPLGAAQAPRVDGKAPWWGVMAVSLALCAGPTLAQTRVHNPNAPKQTPPSGSTTGGSSTSGGSTTSGSSSSSSSANTSSSANSSSGSTGSGNSSSSSSSSSAGNSSSSGSTNPSSTAKPPTNSSSSGSGTPKPAPTPAPTTPPAGPSAGGNAASVSSAADGMRGLLLGKDVRAGTITVARNAFPPLTMRVSPAAVITRDGVPSSLSALEIGSQTVFPDVILVSTGVASDGSLIANKIKATSRDHYWYGRLTAIDPASLSIAVIRSDGQRRVFQVTDHTNIQISGGAHAGWANLQLGGVLEVDWIPGDNDTSATVLEAHSIVLNKSFEGILHRTAPAH